jgi:lipoyl(octanoyl) transferase
MTIMGSITRTTLEWRISDGLTQYPDALSLMRDRVAAIRAGTASELVWLVEHPPIYTAGTSAKPEELTDPTRFPTFAAGRGGQWTYHGPGQRTVYVMLDLARKHGAVPVNDIHCYVNALEEWLIRTLQRFNVKGERRPGRIGIWVSGPPNKSGGMPPTMSGGMPPYEPRGMPATGTEAKIGAIGVRVSRWISWHGVALNVDPDLSHFSGIVPCGVRDHGVTSLAALGHPVTMHDVDIALRAAWEDVFGVEADPVCAVG